MTILELRNVFFSYNAHAREVVEVLKGVSLQVDEGDLLAIAGSSGCGKTTLLKHMNGLLKANSGQILYLGQDIYAKEFDLSGLRKKVGLVFQSPETQLFCRTVLDDVCFGPMRLGVSRNEAVQAAKDSLQDVGLPESCWHMNPFDLSGGQKRCAAIAGVLAMNPEILVMDEPAAGLDPETRDHIMATVENIRTQRRIAVVLVSHSMEDIAVHANRLIVLHEGNVAFQGTPKEVFSHIQELDAIGIGVPQITRITHSLMERGLPLRTPAITVNQAAMDILSIFGRDVRDDNVHNEDMP